MTQPIHPPDGGYPLPPMPSAAGSDSSDADPPPAGQVPAPVPPPSPGPPPGPPPRAAQPIVAEVKTGPGYLVRAIWFLLVGWWLTAIVSAVAWAALVTIIGLPLGIWLINRIPTVLTLRPRTSVMVAFPDGTGGVVASQAKIDQVPWYWRGLWFVLVGWWASGIAMSVAWALVVLIITLPAALWIYNRVPFVASLYRY